MLRRKGLIEDDSDIRIAQLMPAEVVSAVSFISKRAKRTVRAAGAGAAKVAASGAKAAKGVATGAKKAGTAVSVTIKSASPRFRRRGKRKRKRKLDAADAKERRLVVTVKESQKPSRSF